MSCHNLFIGRSNPCLYIYKGSSNEELWIVIYVDDLLVSSNNKELLDKLLTTIDKSFKLSILG